MNINELTKSVKCKVYTGMKKEKSMSEGKFYFCRVKCKVYTFFAESTVNIEKGV